MSGEQIVRYCSPTLAGLKTGNMFSCRYESASEMRNSVRQWNKTLTKKGLRVLPLRFDKNRGLIYIYRPSLLSSDLKDERACRLLSERGYCLKSCERCIISLMDKLSTGEEFPHEIGLFLGYPPEDVYGFIEKGAEQSKLVGTWRVYENVENARKVFAKYDKCTRIYTELYANGTSLEKLTVAC